jgi:hypothetical protein
MTADATNTLICRVTKPRHADIWKATVNIFGTFGSGTVALNMSTDGGTTKVAIKNASGSAYTTTAADNFNMELGNGGRYNDDILIYATLSGATNPSITITVHDNF